MSRLLTLVFVLLTVNLPFVGCLDEPKLEAESSKDPGSEIPVKKFMTETLENLQGAWINAENENQTILISKNVYREKVPGASEKVMEIDAYLHCPAYCSDGKSNISNYSCFILKKNNAAECFAIMKLTEEEWHFTAMEGKPKLMVFKRTPE